MSIGIWIGLALGAGLMAYGLSGTGVSGAIVNAHGILIVFGGTLSAMLINCPFRIIFSAVRNSLSLLLPSRFPSPEAAIDEMVRLARVAQTGGGILSLQDEGQGFADGFAHRAVRVAIATGESTQTRTILERQIKLIRVTRTEDANVFRTVAVLSPMFGILGTLMGMIQVLGNLSDPSKVGPAMAVALSSAFLGISVANFVCVPIAGQLRLVAMRETHILEILLEGILDIAAGKPPYMVELHLSSYSEKRGGEAQRAEAPYSKAEAPATAGGTQ